VAKLAGGVAVINVGADRAPLKEKKAHVEDALHDPCGREEASSLAAVVASSRPEGVDKLELTGDELIVRTSFAARLTAPAHARRKRRWRTLRSRHEVKSRR